MRPAFAAESSVRTSDNDEAFARVLTDDDDLDLDLDRNPDDGAARVVVVVVAVGAVFPPDRRCIPGVSAVGAIITVALCQ
jgi:hypothetical protein